MTHESPTPTRPDRIGLEIGPELRAALIREATARSTPVRRVTISELVRAILWERLGPAAVSDSPTKVDV